MDFVFLVGLMFVVVVVVSVIRVQSQRPRGDSAGRSKVVTQNLDYTILGQRPEIVTEDDPDERTSA